MKTLTVKVKEAEVQLHNARRSAQDFLQATLGRIVRQPSLVEAVRILNAADYGIEDLATVLACQMRLCAQRLDDIKRLQYRRFFVGGVGIGLIPTKGGRFSWCVRGAWNTKHRPKGRKFCAEMRIMHAARDRRIKCQHLVGIYTVGVPREEDLVPLGRPVLGLLRVCEACRALIRGEHRELFIPETSFVSYNPETRQRSHHSLEEIISVNGDTGIRHH
ncbi:MAG: hypothetical protein AAB767_00980 [Patescibacteria group bacterium]